jgi:2-dehydropantoate 2-reductase
MPRYSRAAGAHRAPSPAWFILARNSQRRALSFIAQAAKSSSVILTAAAIPCSVSDNIETVQWTKLLWNAPFCAIGALTRAAVDQILESDELRRLAVDCMTEVQAAALACDIVLPDSRLQETIDFSSGLGRFKPSMLQDLEAGKPLEYEAFNGAVMKRLQSVGKAAPINQCFYALLRQLDQQSRAEAVGQQ